MRVHGALFGAIVLCAAGCSSSSQGTAPGDAGTAIEAGSPPCAWPCSSSDAGSGDAAPSSTPDASSADAATQDGATSDASQPGNDAGAAYMTPPSGWSYTQLVWETQFGYAGMGSSPSAPNEGTFVAGGAPQPDTSVGFLNDWNYGNQQSPGAVWSQSGSNPYWGSSEGAQTGTYASGDAADYSFPGNVFQSSAGADTSLFGAYSPQTFTSQGTGLTLFDHYVGGPEQVAIQSNGSTYFYEWTSGMINTEGKRFFPFGSATEFFAQVRAEMAGPNNGSWSAIWTLPDEGQSGTGQEIDVQEFNVSGPNRDKMYSHVQDPEALVGTGTSSAPLDAGYHVYGWDVDSTTQTVTTYLDGVQTGTFTGAQVGSKYFLILDAAISSGQQSWESSEGFTSSSTADMAMGVAEVQVYQR